MHAHAHYYFKWNNITRKKVSVPYIKLTKECSNLFIAKQNCTTEMRELNSGLWCVCYQQKCPFSLGWEWIHVCKLTCVYSRGSEAIRKYKHTRKDRLRTNPFYQKLTYTCSSHIIYCTCKSYMYTSGKDDRTCRILCLASCSTLVLIYAGICAIGY